MIVVASNADQILIALPWLRIWLNLHLRLHNLLIVFVTNDQEKGYRIEGHTNQGTDCSQNGRNQFLTRLKKVKIELVKWKSIF